MVQILPRFDPGGEIGKSIGSGIGSGAEDVTKRFLLRTGLQSIRDDMQQKREAGESLNPLDITLGLMDKVGTLPGGMQALSDLAPAIHKEVLRHNLSQGNTPAGRSKQMPPGSIIEGDEPEPGQRGGDLPPVQKTFDQMYQENLQRTQDPELASQLTQSQMSGSIAEQNRRAQEQQTAQNFLDLKVGENFAGGISAPFKNELSKRFHDRLKTTDMNQAWKELMPDFRAAQAAEESLKQSTGANRPGLFLGDMEQRQNNAQTTLKPISDIDPEYAMGLAMNDLDYGPSEAAKIVRPGGENYKNFVRQMPDGFTKPVVTQSDRKNRDTWLKNTQKKLDKFLKDKWNPETDSLLSLRGELFDKGFSDELFLESVNKAFPEKNQDPRLSEFNQHEYSKLGEPVLPGLQNIFSGILSGRFMGSMKKALEGTIRRKR